MKTVCIILAAALAGAVPLAACAPPAARPTGALAARADHVVLTGERGFALAELAYTVAAQAAGKLADRGVIIGDTATAVRRLNGKARALLVAGKAAADTADKARAATELLALADQINAIRAGR